MKHFAIILVFTFSLTNQVLAQPGNKNELLSLLSTEQKFIRAAVDSSICIIRQEYILIDSAGNEYGSNNHPFFNRKYAVGVISDKGIWTMREILAPWKYDKTYESFKKNKNLIPKISKTFRKRLNEKTFSDLQITTISNQDEGDTLIAVISLPDSVAYIQSVQNTIDSSGWLVLVSGKVNTDHNDTVQFNYTIYKPNLSFRDSGDKSYIANNIPANDVIIGGVYFTSSVSIGRISFAAAGILLKDEKGWYISTIPGKKHKTRNETDLLTPLKKS